MGKRDYRHHEKKKVKKGGKKKSLTDILTPPVSVELIKKKGEKVQEEEAG